METQACISEHVSCCANIPKPTLQQMLSETRLPLVGAVAHDIDFEGPPEAEETYAQLAQQHS